MSFLLSSGSAAGGRPAWLRYVFLVKEVSYSGICILVITLYIPENIPLEYGIFFHILSLLSSSQPSRSQKSSAQKRKMASERTLSHIFSDVCSQLAHSAKINGFLTEIRCYSLKSVRWTCVTTGISSYSRLGRKGCYSEPSIFSRIFQITILAETLYILKELLEYCINAKAQSQILEVWWA